jgi:hypothetical protein
MSEYINIIVIVEGKTEQAFIKFVLAPYLAPKNIFMNATQVTKPGQKGGDVRFDRVKRDIATHLKQRPDTFVTTLVDYYGIKEWPGINKVIPNSTPAEIAETVNSATCKEVNQLFADYGSERRFIPFIAIHEFETLLFSDSYTLATELGILEEKVIAVLDECEGKPEFINKGPKTAPSKRLDQWSKNGVFQKITKGIPIATTIGISKMRDKCPLFNEWLERFEILQREQINPPPSNTIP